jgi:hypothetical protein
MVRPERFELPTLWFVARCSIQLSYGRNRNNQQRFDYIGNTRIDEREHIERVAYSKHLTAALNISHSASCGKPWHLSCIGERERNSFSPLAIPTLSDLVRVLYFQPIGIGKSDATIVSRRSGAQRGALEDKLRPEVFLDAPCIFFNSDFYPAEHSPPQVFFTRAQVFPGRSVLPALAVPQSLVP